MHCLARIASCPSRHGLRAATRCAIPYRVAYCNRAPGAVLLADAHPRARFPAVSTLPSRRRYPHREHPGAARTVIPAHQCPLRPAMPALARHRVRGWRRASAPHCLPAGTREIPARGNTAMCRSWSARRVSEDSGVHSHPAPCTCASDLPSPGVARTAPRGRAARHCARWRRGRRDFVRSAPPATGYRS